MTKRPILIEGESILEDQDLLIYNRNFDLLSSKIKRCYHLQPKKFRAWQGHKKEQRWFMAVEGSLLLLLVEIDDWKNPSFNLKVQEHVLKAEEGDVLYVPRGYAVGIKPITKEPKLMVYSDFTTEESKKDFYDFDSSRWYVDSFM